MKTKLMKDLRDSLSENIVLCGRDELGQRNRLISKCNIAATFSNADFDSISNIMKIKKNSKQVSIVLGDGAIAKWSSVLSGAGLRYGKDFIDAMSFERIVARMEGYQCPKELVVAYGNCQMHDYFDCLNRTTSFVAKYESAYFKYSEYPKIEVIRKGNSARLVCDPKNLLGIVTDYTSEELEWKNTCGIPFFGLEETEQLADYIMGQYISLQRG